MQISRSQERVLEAGDLRIAIAPEWGGRVTSLSLSGAEILSGPQVHSSNYGSTLWTSPQADWGWPPPPEFDDMPFSEAAREAGAVTLIGPPCPRLGVRLLKSFAIDPRGPAIVVEAQIENVGAVPRAFAPWQVTRVPARGLSFYPAGVCSGGLLPVQRVAGTTWFRHDPGALTETGAKSYADATCGFVAHVHDGLLLVKRFVDLPPERQAPGQGEVEIYGNDRYVEVEIQGPFAVIAPGERSAPWVVRWHLTRLPPELDASLGSSALLAFASNVGAAHS